MKFHLYTGANSGRKKTGDNEFPLAFVGKLLVVVLSLFLLLVYRVSLNQRAEKLNREANRLERSLEKMEREISHLRMKEEQLSGWKFLVKKIREHRLNLRIPKSSQVHSLIGTKDSFYQTGGPVKKKLELTQK